MIRTNRTQNQTLTCLEDIALFHVLKSFLTVVLHGQRDSNPTTFVIDTFSRRAEELKFNAFDDETDQSHRVVD